MRTTLYIEDALLKKAKQAALKEGKSFTAFAEDALRAALVRRKQTPSSKDIVLVTVNGSGLQPGVDLDDSVNLLDLMES